MEEIPNEPRRARRQVIAPPRPRRARKQPAKARRNDLVALRDELLREYFPEGSIVPVIRWAKRRTRRSMGCFVRSEAPEQGGTVFINPLLDDAAVPLYYLRYVIYHELLHAYLPPIQKNGRTHYHHRTFRVREREFRDFARARRWEVEGLPEICKP